MREGGGGVAGQRDQKLDSTKTGRQRHMQGHDELNPEQRIEIPSSAVDITPQWLDAVLRAAGASRKARVISIEMRETRAGTGAGFFSDLYWLNLVFDSPQTDVPTKLVLKRPRSRVDPLLAFRYEKEVNFYRRIAATSPVRTPMCFYAEVDPGTGNFALLLEDLSALTARDELYGCSRLEAEAAIEALANLHVAYWGREDIDESLSTRVIPWQPPTGEMWTKLQEDHSGRLPPGVTGVIRDLPRRLDQLLEFMSRPPYTLLHGDFRLDNMLFGPKESEGAGLDVVLMDWQMARRGRAPVDLAWFLGLSIDVASRQTWQDELLRLYHQGLVRRGVSGYSFDDCVRDYRLSLLTSLCSLALGNAMPKTQGRATEKFDRFAERIASAVSDNDCLTLLQRLDT